MKSFLIEFDYGGCHCECFVQKIVFGKQEIFLVSVKDALLIQKFKGKRFLLCDDNLKDGSVQMVWTAIREQEPHN